MSALRNRRHSPDSIQSMGWGRIMELTQDMLSNARAGDWERVCGLQEERFGLIRQYFAAQPPSTELDRIRPEVSALLDMDAELAALGRRRRDRIEEDLKRLRRGRVVRKAYGGGG